MMTFGRRAGCCSAAERVSAAARTAATARVSRVRAMFGPPRPWVRLGKPHVGEVRAIHAAFCLPHAPTRGKGLGKIVAVDGPHGVNLGLRILKMVFRPCHLGQDSIILAK